MQKILYLAGLVCLFMAFQTEKSTYGKFEYEQIENKNKGFKSHVAFFDLNITKTFSTYSQVYTNDLDEKYAEEQEDGVNEVIVVKPKKDEMRIVYTDFLTGTSFFKEIIAFSKVYVKEDKYTMEWTLSNETKKFGKRECKKAMTTFRGRTYIAWYLPELKTKVGPWKFKNPPGLIFEIYDKENVLHIKLNRFNTNVQSNINTWELEKNKKIITVKEYVKLRNKAEDVVLERLNAKLPKGSAPFVKNTEQKEIEIFN
ncbi:MAG: GLPGLI family protein [Spirosomataceae bacterium]